MSAARRGGATGRGLAAVLALLSVLVLLAVPAVAGRAHASMPSMAAMEMTGAAEITRTKAGAPMRHTGAEALCMAACGLAGQLLPAQVRRPDALRRADAPVRYFTDARRPAGVSEEPGSPPPR